MIIKTSKLYRSFVATVAQLETAVFFFAFQSFQAVISREIIFEYDFRYKSNEKVVSSMFARVWKKKIVTFLFKNLGVENVIFRVLPLFYQTNDMRQTFFDSGPIDLYKMLFRASRSLLISAYKYIR